MFLAPCASATAQRALEIIPPAPQSQERVILRVNTLLPDLCESASVSFSDGAIKVALRCVQVLGPLPPNRNATLDVELGHFPAGGYSVVTGDNDPGAPDNHEFIFSSGAPCVRFSLRIPRRGLF